MGFVRGVFAKSPFFMPGISPDRTEFTQWVREALNRLYDSPFLDAHPLGDILIDPALATSHRNQDLRRVLLAAIQALRPAKNIPQQSHDWRGYQLLEMHYIAGMSQADVMRELGLGRTLYFTEKARILETLANRLWEQQRQPPETPSPSGESPEDELLHLAKEAPWTEIDAGEVVRQLEPLLSALLTPKNIQLKVDCSESLCVLRGNRVLLRQVFLSLVSALVEGQAAGELSIVSLQQAEWQGFEMILTLPGTEFTAGLPVKLQRVAVEMGATLELETHGWDVVVHLGWATRQAAPVVLLVDDNADMMELVTRYLGGTAWQVRWAANGQQARSMLAQARPTVILLDVLMPDEDGWELLLSFKADAVLRGIPVIVCSALREEGLATTLGANGYLLKPLTQPALFQALKAWYSPHSIPGIAL